MDNLGVVAIGRNEGDRLIQCLDSLKQQLPQGVPIIYVDSGSTDNSLAAAKSRRGKGGFSRHVCSLYGS